MNDDTRLAGDPGALSASPDILREVLDSVVAFVGILTPDGILTEANSPALQAAGLKRSDVIGKHFWDCYWWNFDAAVQDRLRAAVAQAAGGDPVRYDSEVRVAEGALITIDFQLVPHRDADGRVDFLVPSGVDITERKRQERLLRAARNTFAEMVINSPFGVYVVDSDFRLAMVSAGAQKVFSQVRPLIGRDFAEILRILWPEPFASEAIERFRHTLATGKSFHEPRTIEKRNDTFQTESYDWKIDRVLLPDGRFGAVCHFYDLSEREEHEAALRASEARFRTTFENAAVGVAHVSPDGHWLRVNQKLCEITGYSQDELIGRKVEDLTHPDDRRKNLALKEAFLAGELDQQQVRTRYRRKDGSDVWVQVTGSCARDESGALQYFIGVIEDISVEMAAEERQELLIGELNHRVKNLLATVQAMASHTLRSSTDMQGFREAFSGRIRAMAAAHDSIFRDGGVQADFATVIRSQLAPYAASSKDKLRLSGPDLRLEASTAHALGLILHELATNAAKYGALARKEGFIAVTWELVSGDGPRRVRLTWTETGGPPMKPPEKAGFGSRLILSTVQSLHGKVRPDFRPEGLKVDMTFDLAEPDTD